MTPIAIRTYRATASVETGCNGKIPRFAPIDVPTVPTPQNSKPKSVMDPEGDSIADNNQRKTSLLVDLSTPCLIRAMKFLP